MENGILEIMPDTWAIEDGDVRIFVVKGREKALVIDTGMSGLNVKSLVESITPLPQILVNTHADMDHIGGNHFYEECYMHPSEGVVYHHRFFQAEKAIPMRPIYEGTEFDLGGRVLKVLHVPGHTPGSITLLDIENRCLIGGDPIQKDGRIYMFGAYRDMEGYILGLEHLLDFREEFDYVFPSHAERKVEKAIIGQLIAGAKDILAGRINGVKTEVHSQAVVAYETEASTFLCDGEGAEN